MHLKCMQIRFVWISIIAQAARRFTAWVVRTAAWVAPYRIGWRSVGLNRRFCATVGLRIVEKYRAVRPVIVSK